MIMSLFDDSSFIDKLSLVVIVTEGGFWSLAWSLCASPALLYYDSLVERFPFSTKQSLPHPLIRSKPVSDMVLC